MVSAATLAASLETLAPHVPPSLISGRRMADIRGVGRVLPIGISSLFGFECRLGETEPRADFLLRMSPAVGQPMLAGAHGTHRLPQELTGHAVWRRVKQFCSSAADPMSPLHGRFTDMWLEFDVGETVQRVPVPSVFMAPSVGSPRQADYSWMARAAVPLLIGHRLSSAVERRLMACIEALPDDTAVFQIGVMLARAVDAVRLCIVFDDATRIPAYLATIGWTGEPEPLRGLLSRLSGSIDAVSLDIDVAETVGPKAGLECYVYGPRLSARWRPFLNDLTSAGLCTEAKREGLLAWPGFDAETASSGDWPEELRRVSAFLGHGTQSVLVRWLHHVKLDYVPNRIVEAKAYLAVRHQWIRPRAATS